MRRYFIAADACKYGDIETIKAMKVSKKSPTSYLQSNLSQSLVWGEFGNNEIMENLLQSGNSIHELALLQAIKYGHLEVTKFLISEYHLDNKDVERKNELQLALERGHLEIVRYLLDIRFNNGIGLDNYSRSLLIEKAIILGYDDILRLLLENVTIEDSSSCILVSSRKGLGYYKISL